MTVSKQKKNRTLALSLLFLLSAVLLLCACGTRTAKDGNAGAEDSKPYEDTGFAMGTVVNQTIYAKDKQVAPKILALLTEAEEKWISWRKSNSDIAAINNKAGSGTLVQVSKETKTYLTEAKKIAADTGGAFDPTVGKLSALWKFDSDKPAIPSKAKVKALMRNIGYNAIKTDGEGVQLAQKSAIDLGAMGKGIGCDKIETYLDRRKDVSGALVNIGGSSVLAYGRKNNGEPWKVAVQNPRDEEGYLGVLSLSGTNHIATSGDYEKYFEAGGKRYHHILDPATGYPADSGLMSVTVVMDCGAPCDAISTACFVLGYEKSQAILKKYNAQAVFVRKSKTVSVTEGLKDKFRLLADDYTLQ